MGIYHVRMASLHDVAQVRLDNALRLFDEFVKAAAAQPDAATLRGLERRFAERLQIHPSYWSQIKSRSRQIGERLARQFELLCRKPHGWMDQPHGGSDASTSAPPGDAATAADDDERFIIGLVLTYYRRHPQRARARLLDLLGEVLSPPAEERAGPVPSKGAAPLNTSPTRTSEPPGDEAWRRLSADVSPLKKKR